ncbi:egl nine homolog 1-like [Liolophura sinensis]|uniref:egl nine homolog 1-like n=1 Tax=Liolophura sinensis TaxID=3198878 RepID=UPI0031593DCB
MADGHCVVCESKVNLKRCVRCRSVMYCSKDHQIADWPTHKKFCQSSRKPKGQSCNATPKDSMAGETTTTPAAQTGTGSFHDGSPNLNANGHIGTKGNQYGLNVKVSTTAASQQVHSTTKEMMQELSPFDQRPLKLATFTAVTGQKEFQVSQCIFAALCSQGYCVLRGIFKDGICVTALDEATRLNSEGQMRLGRLAGGKTSSVEDKKVKESSIRSDKMMWIEGNEIQFPGISKIVKTMDETVAKFNGLKDCRYVFYKRTKAMVACYPGNGSFYRRHVDNPNRDGRVLTCICYLNPNWDTQTDGGVLRLFPGGTDSYVDVVPQSNTLLLFWSDRRSPHEVQPAFRTRYAVTAWFFDLEEREKAKRHACRELNATEEEITMHDIKTKETQKEALRAEMEKQSKRAIDLLSQEEIQAILTLIERHPDPADMLSGLGIAPSIQAELMKLASEQQQSTLD